MDNCVLAGSLPKLGETDTILVMDDIMQKVTALCKRRGFVYPGSEIYGGLAGFYDYGPLGVELKNNIKREWWKSMVYGRDDVVGLDASIIMNPQVWEASGHLEAFTDPLVECEVCHKRFRPDKLAGFSPVKDNGKVIGYKLSDFECPTGRHMLQVIKKQITEIKNKKITTPWQFNLLVTAQLGVVDRQDVYLRGEITQGVFVNFRNVVDSSRMKIPFGIAQVGKAFRNEITPGNFTYRMREFEQMELEFFVKPEEDEGKKWFGYWKKERLAWYIGLGMSKEKLRFREHAPDERAHYAKSAEDIEYEAPFGWSEFEGIHHRGDWDLSRHKLTYFDDDPPSPKATAGQGEKKEYTPWVIETSGGVDRSTLFFLLDAYHEDGERVILKLHPKLAPYKVAVFPLVANKPEIAKKAKEIYDSLKPAMTVAWDDRGNIGKRYYAQDEIGTPWCVTVDYQTLEDNTVTVRDRDTAKQERLPVDKLSGWFQNELGR